MSTANHIGSPSTAREGYDEVWLALIDHALIADWSCGSAEVFPVGLVGDDGNARLLAECPSATISPRRTAFNYGCEVVAIVFSAQHSKHGQPFLWLSYSVATATADEDTHLSRLLLFFGSAPRDRSKEPYPRAIEMRANGVKMLVGREIGSIDPPGRSRLGNTNSLRQTRGVRAFSSDSDGKTLPKAIQNVPHDFTAGAHDQNTSLRVDQGLQKVGGESTVEGTEPSPPVMVAGREQPIE